jgi:hypothetical protein
MFRRGKVAILGIGVAWTYALSLERYGALVEGTPRGRSQHLDGKQFGDKATLLDCKRPQFVHVAQKRQTEGLQIGECGIQTVDERTVGKLLASGATSNAGVERRYGNLPTRVAD